MENLLIFMDNYIKNEKIDLLEKVKEEIMSIGNWREISEVPNEYVVECLNIVDRHIAELKGKQE